MVAHRRQRQGDEVFCARCTKRWGVSEDEPECLTFVELTRRSDQIPDKHGPLVRRSSLTAKPGDVFI